MLLVNVVESGEVRVLSTPKFAFNTKRRRSIGFEVSYESRAYNTVYDEAAAAKVEWPKDGWPVVVASTFNPQMFVDYAMFRDARSGAVSRRDFDTEFLQTWINEQTKGKPTSVPPATLAKWIAGQLMGRLQPSGEGLTYLQNGQLQGIGVIGPEVTFQRGRGSDFDIAATLVAAYRMAGLPPQPITGNAQSQQPRPEQTGKQRTH